MAEGNKGWPASTIVDGIPDIENIDTALRHTKYGQCVYESDNDVCDNQVSIFPNPADARSTLTPNIRW